MPNSKRKKATKYQNKKKIQTKSENVQAYSEPKQTEENISTDKKDKSSDVVFKKGDVVQIKNLQTRPELNGRYTVVTNNALENGRIPIMVDGPNPFALKQNCLELVNECPNKEYDSTIGIIVWPHISGIPDPSCKIMDFRCVKPAHDNQFAFHIPYLKENFGWTEPCCIKFHDFYLVFDKDSNGPINDWCDSGGNTSRSQTAGVTIKGPFICFEKENSRSSLNDFKIFAHLTKYHDTTVDIETYNDEEAMKRFQEKCKDKRVHVTTKIKSSRVCLEKFNCKLCKRIKKEYELRMERVEELLTSEYDEWEKYIDQPKDMSKRHARDVVELQRLQEQICAELNVKYEDFYATIYKFQTSGRMASVMTEGELEYWKKTLVLRKGSYKILSDRIFRQICDETNKRLKYNQVKLTPVYKS